MPKVTVAKKFEFAEALTQSGERPVFAACRRWSTETDLTDHWGLTRALAGRSWVEWTEVKWLLEGAGGQESCAGSLDIAQLASAPEGIKLPSMASVGQETAQLQVASDWRELPPVWLCAC